MKPLILLTNDDGIQSPGLAAAAAALDPLGDLLIVAPQEGQTSMSRSRNQKYGGGGTITEAEVRYQESSWKGFSVQATPALTVIHALYELADRSVSLVVSGINYGENVGSCVTVSGTIGAAIEAAEKGLPTLAVSNEIAGMEYHDFSAKIDFTSAIHFTQLVAERMLANRLPYDADILKLEIPLDSSASTPLVVTKQDKLMYYQPKVDERDKLYGTTTRVYYQPGKGKYTDKTTDTYAMAQGWVSLTPLSFDLTSRIKLEELAKLMGASMPNEEKQNQ